MDRKSGFKECPKCGLRNKPSATQCDFCGQNLDAPDDWQQHVKDLESLNKMELRKPLDDRTSKRIESTIIRKDSPPARNMEIKEAGNIGKVLRDLDRPQSKEKAGDARGERPRQAPVQDKLRIKEASFVPLVERDDDEPSPKEAVAIADVLKEAPKDDDAATIPETRPLTERASSEALLKAEVGEPVKEQVQRPTEEPDLAQLLEGPQESRSEADDEPQAEEEPEEDGSAADNESQAEEKPEEPIITSAVSGPSDAVETANEVTIEVVQPLHEPVLSTEGPIGEDQQITVSSNDSHETIKLKLVEVERPKEKLAPMAVERSIPRPTLAGIAVLGVGSVVYLVVLALIAVGLLGTAAGLGGGAVSSFMIIIGATLAYPSLRKKNETEVYICPKCHEKVGKSSDGCPACGAEFED